MRAPVLALAPLLLLATGADASGIDSMRWQRRVLLLSAPAPDDPALRTQLRTLDTWRAAAADRDLTTVTLVADTVTGTTDSAPDLRRRYGLPPDRFAALLIGKDGHVAVRSPQPVATADLERTIDAMPMRRAGQR